MFSNLIKSFLENTRIIKAITFDMMSTNRHRRINNVLPFTS